MIVWRVQNSEGYGPYRRMGNYNSVWTTRSHDTPKHPAPCIDKPAKAHDVFIQIHSDYRHGFRTKRQALEWFTKKELANLAEIGYHLVKVEAIRVCHLRKQTLFVPKES